MRRHNLALTARALISGPAAHGVGNNSALMGAAAARARSSCCRACSTLPGAHWVSRGSISGAVMRAWERVKRRRRLADLLSRQLNFSRTCWITFHCRGITSSVSEMSSPSLRSRALPQHGQSVGAGSTTCSRGRCAGKGWRAGRLRVKAATLVALATAGRDLVLARRTLELLEGQLHLVEQLHGAFRALAIELARQLGDL